MTPFERANNRRIRTERARAGEIVAPHGTTTGYHEYGCRCESCREANSAYETARRRAKGVQPLKKFPEVERREAIAVALSEGVHAASLRTGVKPGTVATWCYRAGVTPYKTPLKGHGTVASYGRGCRCVDCRQANRERVYANKRRRLERVAAGLMAVPHGRYGYSNYDCRCEVCTKAASNGNREAARRWQDRQRTAKRAAS